MASASGHPEPPDFPRIRHDLRTPVNHILGYTEILLEDDGTPDDFRDDLRRIHTGGRHLLSLIKDYFDDEHFAQKRPDRHRFYHTGLHSGPLAAGIIGRDKFAYALWGDTVNTASRMESSAPIDAIHVSPATAALLSGDFILEPRGPINIKGLGVMGTWVLTGRSTPSLGSSRCTSASSNGSSTSPSLKSGSPLI